MSPATKRTVEKNWQGLAAKDRPERLVNLSMFVKNGHLINVDGQTGAAIMRTMPYVTLGRTYSKRGIGFEIEDAAGNLVAEFVLDRNQVKALRRFLTYSLPRLKEPRRPSRLTTSIGKRTKTAIGRRWDGALLSSKQVKRQWKSGQVVHPIVWCVA